MNDKPMDDPIPIEVLDDEDARTPAFMELRKQQGQSAANVIPRGTYEARLIEVSVVRRKDGGGWVLRMVAKTTRLGRYLLAWRGLSEGPFDPWDLTEGQRRGFDKFAQSMGVGPGIPQACVDELHELAAEGALVDARVSQTPVGPQAAFSIEGGAAMVSPLDPSSTSLVDGQVIDANGEVVEGAAAAAFASHKRVVDGKQTVNEGLVAMARGCAELRVSEGWRALGFDSVGLYLASPEVNLARSQFYRLADIWQSYVVDGGLEPAQLAVADESKLEVPLAALKQGVVSAEEALADAEALPRNDLRDRYRDLLEGREGSEPTVRAAGPAGPVDEPVSGESPAGGTNEPGLGSVGEDLSGELERLHGHAAELEARLLSKQRTLELVAGALAHIVSEIGAPEKKKLSRALRAEANTALDAAREHGLNVGGE